MRSMIWTTETFDIEGTPSSEKLSQRSHKTHRPMVPRGDDDDGVHVAHGHLEAQARDASTAAHSIHQLTASDAIRTSTRDDSGQDAAHADANTAHNPINCSALRNGSRAWPLLVWLGTPSQEGRLRGRPLRAVHFPVPFRRLGEPSWLYRQPRDDGDRL